MDWRISSCHTTSYCSIRRSTNCCSPIDVQRSEQQSRAPLNKPHPYPDPRSSPDRDKKKTSTTHVPLGATNPPIKLFEEARTPPVLPVLLWFSGTGKRFSGTRKRFSGMGERFPNRERFSETGKQSNWAGYAQQQTRPLPRPLLLRSDRPPNRSIIFPPERRQT